MKSGLVMVAFKMVGDVVALKSSLVMVAFEECLCQSSTAKKICCIAVFNVFRNL